MLRGVCYRSPFSLLTRRTLKISTAIAAFREGNMMQGSLSSAPKSVTGDTAYPLFRIQCAQQFKCSAGNIDSMVKLVEEGATVPFIVRYRSYAIGGLGSDASVIYAINRCISAYAEVVKSKFTKLTSLQRSGRLTDSLYKSFSRCTSVSELDELWGPFKESKSSRLNEMRQVEGLEALVDDILFHQRREFDELPMKSCKYSFRESLQYLLADGIGHRDTQVSEYIAKNVKPIDIFVRVKLKASKSLPPGHNRETCKYKPYHDMTRCPLSSLRDHQVRFRKEIDHAVLMYRILW